jgi:hypothetical protein
MKVASRGLCTFSRRASAILLLTCAGALPIAACAGDTTSSAPAMSSTESTSAAPPTSKRSRTVPAPPPGPETLPPPTVTPPSSSVALSPSTGSPPSTEVSPSPTVAATPLPDSRWQAEQSELVNANAYWRRPDALKVNEPAQIGLGIQTAPLTTQINARMNELPGTNQPAGQIQVSPQATAQLVASPTDAEVTPSGFQNTSFDQYIQMAWQWTITPKRPTSDLILTAYVIVHIEGGPDAVITTPITLHIPVQRTVPYTLERIFTNWGTWSAIAVAFLGGATWITKKVRRAIQPSTT